jgi:hypothetical protein
MIPGAKRWELPFLPHGSFRTSTIAALPADFLHPLLSNTPAVRRLEIQLMFLASLIRLVHPNGL